MSLESVSGVGPKTAEKLITGGISTVDQLSNQRPQEIVSILGISTKAAKEMINSAKELAFQDTSVYTAKEFEEKILNTVRIIKTGSSRMDDLLKGGLRTRSTYGYFGPFACLPSYTKIKYKNKEKRDGERSYKSIQCFKKGDIIYALDISTGEIVEDEVIYVKKRTLYKDEPMFLIKTDEGHVIAATGNHPFLTDKGWIKTMELNIGDSLYSEKNTPEKIKVWVDHNWLGGERIKGTFTLGHSPLNIGVTPSKESRIKMSMSRKKLYSEIPETMKAISRKGAINARKKLAKRLPIGQMILVELLAKRFGVEIEYPIQLDNSVVITDIAIPSDKIAIFYDGKYWHNKSEDDGITQKLNQSGWSVIRFNEDASYDDVSNQLSNIHLGDMIDPKITEIIPYRTRFVYDLSTKTHHNFIANGLIVHNTGKSQAVNTAIVNCVVDGMYALIVETEPNTFYTPRLVEIASKTGVDLDLDKIIVYPALQVGTVYAQFKGYEYLNRYAIEKNLDVGIVAVDSFNSKFRRAFSGREMFPERAQELGRHIDYLEEMAKKFNAAILLTFQVGVTPDDSGTKQDLMRYQSEYYPYGGTLVSHNINTWISLNQIKGGAKSTSVYEANLADSSWLPKGSCQFIISDRGIEDF